MQIVDFLHFLEQLLLTIILAFDPLLPQNFAVGDGLAEGQCIDKKVLEDSRMGADAGNEVSVVFLAEVSEFKRDV